MDVFSPKEEERLKTAYEMYKDLPNSWAKIAEYVGTKSYIQCYQQYNRRLDPTLKKGRWTPEEDESLLKAVDVAGYGNWSAVAKLMGNRRNGSRCQTRYAHLLTLKGFREYKQGYWSADEVRKLKNALNRYRNRTHEDHFWQLVSCYVRSRSALQCRLKYKTSLEPGVNYGQLLKEEDYDRFLKLIEQYGRRYGKISEYFPGHNGYTLFRSHQQILCRMRAKARAQKEADDEEELAAKEDANKSKSNDS